MPSEPLPPALPPAATGRAYGEAMAGVAHKVGEIAEATTEGIATAAGAVAHKAEEILPATHNKPTYTKFDYQKAKGISDDDVGLMHTVTVNKKESILDDELCGIQLELLQDDKSITVKQVSERSPFHSTPLLVGSTVFCINGEFDFESAEQAERVIREENELVTVICGNVKDGRLQPKTDVWPSPPPTLQK